MADTELLEGSERCFLAAVGGDPEAPAVAWMEVSTGTFEGMACPDRATAAEQLARVNPRELLVAEGWEDWHRLWPAELSTPTVTPLPPEDFSPADGERRLLRALGVGSLRGFGLGPGEPLVGLAGALVAYVERTQRGGLGHVRGFRRRHPADGLVLDRATIRNLEILAGADGSKRTALATVLDHTRTRMGARLLREWLLHPSCDLDTIGARHQAVVLALGAGRGSMPGIPGEELDGCSDALSFARRLRDGRQRLAGPAVVFGAGHMAAAAARTALRAGCRPVQLHLGLKARSAAEPDTVVLAEQEGVEIVCGTRPLELLGEGSLRAVKMAGAAGEIPARHFIAAASRVPDVPFAGVLEPGPGGLIKTAGNLMTTRPGVFCAGEVTQGVRDVLRAAASGKRAAAALLDWWRGRTS